MPTQRWDEKCPHCKKKIDDIYESFMASDYDISFSFSCPHCRQPIDVEVVSVPEFGLSKPEPKGAQS